MTSASFDAMNHDERWLVMAPTDSEGIYREVATFSSEADATEFCEQEGDGDWQVLDASEMDIE